MKQRLDIYLFENGLAESREKAKALIMDKSNLIKDGIFEDDYVTGEIRDDYLDTNNKEEHSNSIEDFMKE